MPKSKTTKAWETAGYTRITLGKTTELARAEKALVVNGVTQETN